MYGTTCNKILHELAVSLIHATCPTNVDQLDVIRWRL